MKGKGHVIDNGKVPGILPNALEGDGKHTQSFSSQLHVMIFREEVYEEPFLTIIEMPLRQRNHCTVATARPNVSRFRRPVHRVLRGHVQMQDSGFFSSAPAK
ncbi:hypothetical protein, unlikely [Trypanosoma brucei gambiense DAL972]|uniref:Uncharacterized protein n=1 Tax=Trypanosoma brucei gambiense (strain MHOM/CI/86/DAL972) TaxID=679716 RepID=C9ZPR9_TRYB9|nr:hypothetical protein, unlikely [Trypanosoma brucei gambiense DAL972]CBH11397.1 hypothetical protein, unlikely [Trypanosoma brucei gambiense DAL972]|eukprot:XP_011773684.1 hypothetical protein, unlikely [Trypanosoma brucei gambiense DAL972]